MNFYEITCLQLKIIRKKKAPQKTFLKKSEKNIKKGLTKQNKLAIIKPAAQNGAAVGSIAQLGEHLPYKQRVIGSSPVVPTIFPAVLEANGLVAQLVRAPPCHGGGRGFEPHPGRHCFLTCLCSSVGRAED